jgi:hypothetical protein
VIIVAPCRYRRAVGVARHILDVGVGSRDPAISHDVAFLDGVLRFVRPPSIVLDICGLLSPYACASDVPPEAPAKIRIHVDSLSACG